jgi:hypothetical protein
MLHVRPEQMKVLNEHMLRKFEDRMVAHLNQFFAEQCKKLGEDGTRKAIRDAMERAAGYEIVSERDVCIYIDIMFEFGRDFDKDPKLPWANKILNDKALKGEQTEKVDRLYDAAMKNLKQAKGIKVESET